MLFNLCQVWSWDYLTSFSLVFLYGDKILTPDSSFICDSVPLIYFLKWIWTLLVVRRWFWDLRTTLYNRILLWVFELDASSSKKKIRIIILPPNFSFDFSPFFDNWRGKIRMRGTKNPSYQTILMRISTQIFPTYFIPFNFITTKQSTSPALTPVELSLITFCIC